MGQTTNENHYVWGFRDLGTVEKELRDCTHKKHVVPTKPTKRAGARKCSVWGCPAEWKVSAPGRGAQHRAPSFSPAAGAQAASLGQIALSFHPFSPTQERRGRKTQQWLEVRAKIYSAIFLVLQVLLKEETRSKMAAVFKVWGFIFNVRVI